MRLIDADALKIKIEEELYSNDYEEHIYQIIDNAPTVSADRPHGEWKHTITWQPYCSNCEYVFGEDEEYSPFWKFCPNCGADMRGKEE